MFLSPASHQIKAWISRASGKGVKGATSVCFAIQVLVRNMSKRKGPDAGNPNSEFVDFLMGLLNECFSLFVVVVPINHDHQLPSSTGCWLIRPTVISAQ